MIKKPDTSRTEKLPDLGSIVKDAPAPRTALAILLFCVMLALEDGSRGFDGGEGEMKYLLGERLALIASTNAFVKSTETM